MLCSEKKKRFKYLITCTGCSLWRKSIAAQDSCKLLNDSKGRANLNCLHNAVGYKSKEQANINSGTVSGGKMNRPYYKAGLCSIFMFFVICLRDNFNVGMLIGITKERQLYSGHHVCKVSIISNTAALNVTDSLFFIQHWGQLWMFLSTQQLSVITGHLFDLGPTLYIMASPRGIPLQLV